MSGLKPLPIALTISLAMYNSSASSPFRLTIPSSLLTWTFVFVSCSIVRLISPFLPMSTATRSFGMRSSYENSCFGVEVMFSQERQGFKNVAFGYIKAYILAV